MKKLIIILSLMFLLTVCRSTLGNDKILNDEGLINEIKSNGY